MNTVKIRNLEIGKGMPKICVPIVGRTKQEILESAKEAIDGMESGGMGAAVAGGVALAATGLIWKILRI